MSGSNRPWKPRDLVDECEDHIARAVGLALNDGIPPQVIGDTLRRFVIGPSGRLIDWSEDPRIDPAEEAAAQAKQLTVVRPREVQLRLPFDHRLEQRRKRR
jgi:hypothetical protein